MKKISLKKIFGMKLFLVVLVLILGLFSFNFFKEYNRNRQLNAEIQKLEEMAKDLEAQNIDILNLAKYLDTEEFLESEARTKLGLHKEGEEVVVVNIPGSKMAEQEGVVQEKEKISNWHQWWKYFFGSK
ncbi:septum formation initiator family protein [Patescibacteria group bacterium]